MFFASKLCPGVATSLNCDLPSGASLSQAHLCPQYSQCFSVDPGEPWRSESLIGMRRISGDLVREEGFSRLGQDLTTERKKWSRSVEYPHVNTILGNSRARERKIGYRQRWESFVCTFAKEYESSTALHVDILLQRMGRSHQREQQLVDSILLKIKKLLRRRRHPCAV